MVGNFSFLDYWVTLDTDSDESSVNSKGKLNSSVSLFVCLCATYDLLPTSIPSVFALKITGKIDILDPKRLVITTASCLQYVKVQTCLPCHTHIPNTILSVIPAFLNKFHKVETKDILLPLCLSFDACSCRSFEVAGVKKKKKYQSNFTQSTTFKDSSTKPFQRWNGS